MIVLLSGYGVDLFKMITVFQPTHLKSQWVFINNLAQSDICLHVTEQLGFQILEHSPPMPVFVETPQIPMTECHDQVFSLKSLKSSTLVPLNMSFVWGVVEDENVGKKREHAV